MGHTLYNSPPYLISKHKKKLKVQKDLEFVKFGFQ